MEPRGIISPRRSNPKKTPPAHLPGCTSAPELTIQSAVPSTTSNRRTTKSASQPSPSIKKGKAGGSGSRKDGLGSSSGSSHKKYSDYSPNHSPSPAKTLDLQQLSIHDVNDLEQHNSGSSAPTMLFKIYEEIASHRQGNTSIKTYFKNLKALWDEAAASSIHSNSPQSSSNNTIVEQSELMEREKLMQLLLGLNDSYYSLCSQILAVRPSPTVDQACSLIILEEKTRKSKMTKKNTM